MDGVEGLRGKGSGRENTGGRWYVRMREGLKGNELARGTIELVQHFRLKGEFASTQERGVVDINFIWFGYIARLSQWGGGSILLVQMISTCLRSA